MGDIRIRGYMVANAAGYLQQAGAGEGQRAFEKLSAATKQTVTAAKPAEWYPVAHMSEICDAVAALGHGNEERAKEELIKCGRHIAKEATNTFLRLLMRMLTPARFAAKIPDFWKRDCTGGRLVVEVTDQKFMLRIYDIQEWDHVIVTTVGYVGFALEAMGKVIETVAIHEWSLARPNVDGSWLEMTWKA